MNDDIKISVVIPIFNSSLYIKDCLDSILKQTKIKIEVIAVNDGSTDDSLDILNGYRSNDERLVIISKINEGPAVARNVGIDVSNGEYLMFVDSDDVIREGAIEYIHSLICREHLDLYYFKHQTFSELSSLSFNEETNYSLMIMRGIDYIQNNVSTGFNCDKVWQRKFYIEKKLKVEDGFYYEDQIPTLKGFIEADKCGISNYDFYGYRKSEYSITNSKISEKHITNLIYILDEYLTICFKKNVYLSKHAVRKISTMYLSIIKYQYLIIDNYHANLVFAICERIRFIKKQQKGNIFSFYVKYGPVPTGAFYLPALVLKWISYLKN